MKVFLCTILLAGYALAAPDLRIIGGENTIPHKHPYMVSIQQNMGDSVDQSYFHICGGSIIHDRWILTAANCVEDMEEDIRIVAGAHQLSQLDGTEQIRTPKKIVMHYKYEGKNARYYDLALVQLNIPLDFNEKIGKVKLPETDPYYPIGLATVTGWGATNLDDPFDNSDILMKADLPIIPPLKCYGRDSDGFQAHLTSLCAGALDGSKGVCVFDSGNPLVQRNAHGEPIQIGVVIYGWEWCAEKDTTGFFVNTSFFIQWIYDTMGVKIGC